MPRVEDWLLVAWVALASPVIFQAGGGKGPFDGGQPLEGAFRIAAVIGALSCVAARRRPDLDQGARPANMAAVGPFTGGLLLIAISGFTALGANSPTVGAIVVVGLVAMLAARFLLPPVGVMGRRLLVTPLVMVAGGLYWSVIQQVSGIARGRSGSALAGIDSRAAMTALAFLAVFSAVYYAMLIYAPRQLAEREGNGFTWIIRYFLFLAGLALGIGWLGAIAT